MDRFRPGVRPTDHKRRTLILFAVALALGMAGTQTAPAGENAPTTAEVDRVLEVDEVWPGHPVGFALLTHGEHQFVGYYDAERRMTRAQRRLGSDEWTDQKLPRRHRRSPGCRARCGGWNRISKAWASGSPGTMGRPRSRGCAIC
jgi:hypothetical protein